MNDSPIVQTPSNPPTAATSVPTLTGKFYDRMSPIAKGTPCNLKLQGRNIVCLDSASQATLLNATPEQVQSVWVMSTGMYIKINGKRYTFVSDNSTAEALSMATGGIAGVAMAKSIETKSGLPLWADALKAAGYNTKKAGVAQTTKWGLIFAFVIIIISIIIAYVSTSH